MAVHKGSPTSVYHLVELFQEIQWNPDAQSVASSSGNCEAIIAEIWVKKNGRNGGRLSSTVHCTLYIDSDDMHNVITTNGW